MKGVKELKLLVQQLRPSRYGGEEDRRRGTGDRSNNMATVRGHQYLSSHICFFGFIQSAINFTHQLSIHLTVYKELVGSAHPTFIVILSDAG